MKRLFFIFSSSLVAFWSFSGSALTDGRILLEGKVRSFDQNVVKLVSGKKIVVIPRRLIPTSDLKVDSTVKVEVLKTDVVSIKYENL